MNKKILIGVIISIIILVGVSFTSVVGYNKLESNIGVSPLFNIRSSRAIDEESKDVTREYLGKGTNINILFKNKIEESLFLRFLNRLREMNDEEIRDISLFFKNYIPNNKISDIDEIKLATLTSTMYGCPDTKDDNLDCFLLLLGWLIIFAYGFIIGIFVFLKLSIELIIDLILENLYSEKLLEILMKLS